MEIPKENEGYSKPTPSARGQIVRADCGLAFFCRSIQANLGSPNGSALTVSLRGRGGGFARALRTTLVAIADQAAPLPLRVTLGFELGRELWLRERHVVVRSASSFVSRAQLARCK
jgi:hypothetical protein